MDIIQRMIQKLRPLKDDEGYYFIGGRATVIVPETGLTVEWVNPDLTKGQRRIPAGEKLSVVQVKGNWLSVSCDMVHPVWLHESWFNSFLYKVDRSTQVSA